MSTGRVAGQVALVTGAARGQGRSHAARLAQEGADIMAFDVCADIDGVAYAGSTERDLRETAKAVERFGRRVYASPVDVRSRTALEEATARGAEELGGLDIVCANAGIVTVAPVAEMPDAMWAQMLDINLSGVWRTCQASLPYIRDGGALILTSSTLGLRGMPGLSHYAAAKHGVVGLMRTLAVELAPRRIRVNSVHPTAVDTDMIRGADFQTRLHAAARQSGLEDRHLGGNALPVGMIDPVDISNAVLFLASDEARYITGVALPVDAGALLI